MKPFTTLSVVILGLFGLVHLFRLIGQWPVTVNGLSVPTWVSTVALIVAWVLAAQVWREHRP
jgi:hypothetical protein